MKKILFFTGGRKENSQENADFSHTYNFLKSLKDSKKINITVLSKDDIFSFWNFGCYDLVISVGFLSFWFVLLRKLGIIRCPVLHSWNDDYHKCGGFGGSWLRRKLEYWTVGNADFNLTCSRYRESLAKKWGGRIKFIPHGICDCWDEIPVQKLEGVSLVYIGEISSRKGSFEIVSLAKDFPGLTFHVFGWVNHGEEKLLENLPDNLKFHGFVKNEVALSYCKGADFLLHPTDNDSTLKMRHYLKSGGVVLASPGQVEVSLKDGREILICRDFKKCLRRALNNKKLCREISTRARKVKSFFWKDIRQEYLNFVLDVLKPIS